MGSCIPFSSTINSLDVVLDTNLTLNQYIESICYSAHYHSRTLRRHIRPVISDCVAATLAGPLEHSRLDYDNYDLWHIDSQAP